MIDIEIFGYMIMGMFLFFSGALFMFLIIRSFYVEEKEEEPKIVYKTVEKEKKPKRIDEVDDNTFYD